MLSIQKGEDLLSISLNNILSYRKEEQDFVNLVLDWDKNIIIEVQDFYPVEIIFKGNQIKFKTKDFDKKIHLRIKMDLKTLLDLANSRIGPISAVLKGRLKIKGIIRIGTLLKFMKIVLKTMKMVAENPNTNYFEQNRRTR
jgi:putative sterol carrier protein